MDKAVIRNCHVDPHDSYISQVLPNKSVAQDMIGYLVQE